MATYTYRAIDANANILAGKLQARDEADLEHKLTGLGLTLIEAVKAGLFGPAAGATRFSQQDLVNFSYLLHMIITSGLSLMNGLGDTRVEAGMSLSEAMQEYPAVFPECSTRKCRTPQGADSYLRNRRHLTRLMSSPVPWHPMLGYLAEKTPDGVFIGGLTFQVRQETPSLEKDR